MDSENQIKPEIQHLESENSELPQIAFLRGLADIAREENLTELEVEQSGVRITLRAIGADAYAVGAVSQPFYTVAPHSPIPTASGGQTASIAPNAAIATAQDENLIEIVSPMVGVFYRAPSPADKNFIEIGETVEIGQTVALVEAMKVFNEILAETAGTVVEIKSQSSDLVETGQVIITLRA